MFINYVVFFSFEMVMEVFFKEIIFRRKSFLEGLEGSRRF